MMVILGVSALPSLKCDGQTKIVAYKVTVRNPGILTPLDYYKRRFTPCTKPPEWIKINETMTCKNCLSHLEPAAWICWDADLRQFIRCERCRSRSARLTPQVGHLDRFILRRYWNPKCAEIVKELRTRFSGRMGPWAEQVRAVVEATKAAFREALGDEAVDDLVFEYQSASAYEN